MQGQLFTRDFLERGIRDLPPWQELSMNAMQAFEAALRSVFAAATIDAVHNEANTEDLFIVPVLRELSWADLYLRQVNASGKRRDDVPDMLLFPDEPAKAKAVAEKKDDRRYRHGLAILEAKRWMRQLDRGDLAESATDAGAPSSQMLRYLSRVDVVSDRAVKWGVLTNGSVWRLYWQNARSRVEDFFEIDLAAVLELDGSAPWREKFDRAHALKLFFLLFHRAAFLRQTWDSQARSFHAIASAEARRYEAVVSQDLGQRVFDEVFARLAQALAKSDVEARKHDVGYGQFRRKQYTSDYLDELREAALILLYRLLFLFYAEDRGLLPVFDERYRSYSITLLRERVRDDLDKRRTLSTRIDTYWKDLQGVFLLIDQGDDGVGMPAYDGGLFDRARAPLLERARVPDADMAPVIDALSRRTEDLLHAWINYRDLSVSHLGGIYERLLEYTLVHEVQAEDDYRDKPEVDRIAARPASFARKTSGSYYTHHDLVKLILQESVGRLADERVAAFEAQIRKWKSRDSLTTREWNLLDGTPDQAQRDSLDPATRMLEITACDPAMGSGHFLVALVDDLADRVLEAVDTAEHLVNDSRWAAHLAERGRPWQSPVVSRIAGIRRAIGGAARQHGWTVTDTQLDDRHIVRRMILKKVIFGVDKNPMAVELAKTALWLHTFTVGAPLSFLDHHLRCGDSLHGERLPAVRDGLQNLGVLFQRDELERLARAASNLAQVSDLTDVDLAEARLSKDLARQADDEVAPVHALLDFWRAMRWLLPAWPVVSAGKLGKLTDEPMRQALAELLPPIRNLFAALNEATLEGDTLGVRAANGLIARARALALRERFFHWWTAFPTVFDVDGLGGFDAVIGNPPWDRIKLQEVEWFAERDPDIAAQPRAADRKRIVTELEKKKAPLAAEYALAVERAEANARVLSKAGDYPLLGGGDVNLYSLFVERAQGIVHPKGIVALLTPSGIAADKGAAAFFKGVATTGRLGALFDFENKKVFFPDVHASFKFSALVMAGEARRYDSTRCAFYLRGLEDLATPGRVLTLDSAAFELVNPNTGAAPIFRSQRDADITMRLYREHPVLVRHGAKGAARVWPVKYVRMFDMTNDSHRFKTRAELEQEGFRPAVLGRWRKGDVTMLPLYVGRMIHQYDHRHASVTVNEDNLHNAAFGATLDASAKADPNVTPVPQFWVSAADVPEADRREWTIGFRDIARATDVRTMIACVVPGSAAGNTLPLLVEQDVAPSRIALLLGNLNTYAFDYVARQKAQSTHLNWYILEQLPVVDPRRFDARIGKTEVADFVREQVLRLTYTAHDLEPFARDLGHVDALGKALPPFRWDAEDRRARMAALDGLFMHLYGLSDEDAAYVLDTFPIVREQDEAAFGRFRTKDDVLEQVSRIRAGVLSVRLQA